jgi:hypothetical protein
MSKLSTEGLAAIGGLFMFLLVGCLLVALFAICGYMFDYSLMCITGRNVPFWADIIGGIATNGILLIVTVLCWIARLAGYETPFIN